MGTFREHAEELNAAERWDPVSWEAAAIDTMPWRRCPWCAALVANTSESMYTHAQWHVSHMVRHQHNQTEPMGHPVPG